MNGAPEQRRSFRPDIEGLRAIAVLVVMAYHAGWTALGGGFAGVDVFFVVSGFVITSQLLRELDSDGTIRLGRFYARRAKRLLPAAAVVLAVTAVAAWVWAPVTQVRAIATDLAASGIYLVNWQFAARSVDYLAEDLDPSPVQHFWSLAVEEQFYLLWPVLLLSLAWLARRAGGRITRRGLAVGLSAVVVLPSLGWALHLTSADPSRAFFVTTTRLWELGVGALVAIGAALWSRVPPALGAALAAAGLGTVLAGVLLQDSATPWPGPGALVPVLGTAAVIIGGFSAGGSGLSRALGSAPMIKIGALSYSLYLWHWTVLRIATWRFGELSLVESTFWVAASAVPAVLCYRWVEQPVRNSTLLNTSSSAALSVGLNATLVSVLAGVILLVSVGSPPGAAASGGDQVGNGSGAAGAPVRPGADAGDSPLYPRITPDPLLATDDLPATDSQGCQVDVKDPEPFECVSGDPDGEVVVAMVGDSKIAQWHSAVDLIAAEHGWRLIRHTKSGCSPTDALVYDDGAEDADCRLWGAQVKELIATDPPDVVLVSGRRYLAGPEVDQTSPELLAQGYIDYWDDLAAGGTQIIFVSDSPHPGEAAPVYECVARHSEDPDQCTWAYQPSASNAVMQQAVAGLPGATFVDMDPWVCPDGTCPAVHRNILTYRQGSHITDTYAHYLLPALERELVPLIPTG